LVQNFKTRPVEQSQQLNFESALWNKCGKSVYLRALLVQEHVMRENILPKILKESYDSNLINKNNEKDFSINSRWQLSSTLQQVARLVTTILVCLMPGWQLLSCLKY
jgi:hypothetical protein